MQDIFGHNAGLSRPSGIALDSKGNIYVVSHNLNSSLGLALNAQWQHRADLTDFWIGYRDWETG